MVEFVVVEITSRDPEGHGSHEFRVAPNLGDMIVFNDDEGVGQAYKVIGRSMPLDPVSTAGDIYIVHQGTEIDFVNGL